MEIATLEPRFRGPTKPEDRRPHGSVCYKAGSLALLLNGGGDHAHIFWTLGVKRPEMGFIMSRTGGLSKKVMAWFRLV